MAATASDFATYFASTVNPYAGCEEAQLLAFSPDDNAITAELCLAQSESDDYPLGFLASDRATHQPLLLLAPLSGWPPRQTQSQHQVCPLW